VDGTIAVVPAGPAVQTSSTDPADDSKGVSCPDLSAATGAVPYREDAASSTMSPSGPRHVSYTVYRSYSNVAEAARRPEPRPDIRFITIIYTFLCSAALFRLLSTGITSELWSGEVETSTRRAFRD